MIAENTVCIIPIHNQEKNIASVFEGYASQKLLPRAIVCVLDRCTDGSKAQIEIRARGLRDLGVVVETIVVPTTNGFSAGITRDAGISYVEAKYDPDIFVFTDGDCIPGPDCVSEHVKAMAMASSTGPCVTCGPRSDINEDETISIDVRTLNDWCKKKVFAQTVSRYVIWPEVIASSWACWSCNTALNKLAIQRCREVNTLVGSNATRVFSSVFDGRWGGEDGFVAISLFYTNADVVMLPLTAYITHIWHPRNHTNAEHIQVLVNLKTRFRRLIKSVPAYTADVFSGAMLSPYNGSTLLNIGDLLAVSDTQLSQQTKDLVDLIMSCIDVDPKHLDICRVGLAYTLSRNPKMVYSGYRSKYTPRSPDEIASAQADLNRVLALATRLPVTMTTDDSGKHFKAVMI